MKTTATPHGIRARAGGELCGHRPTGAHPWRPAPLPVAPRLDTAVRRSIGQPAETTGPARRYGAPHPRTGVRERGGGALPTAIASGSAPRAPPRGLDGAAVTDTAVGDTGARRCRRGLPWASSCTTRRLRWGLAVPADAVLHNRETGEGGGGRGLGCGMGRRRHHHHRPPAPAASRRCCSTRSQVGGRQGSVGSPPGGTSTAGWRRMPVGGGR